MRRYSHIIIPKARSFAHGSFGYGLLTALGLLIMHQGAAAQTSNANTDTAAKSLESVLKQAAEKGFLQTKTSEGSAGNVDAKRSSSTSSARPLEAPKQPSPVDCKIASRANIMNAAAVDSLDDIKAAKSDIGSDETVLSDIDTVILRYLALGLGTEALALSERNDATLKAAMARVVAGEASAQDAQLIGQYENCDKSLKIWNLAAKLSQDSANSTLKNTETYKITEEIFETLSKFPIHLREIFELNFAEYAAETGDFLAAETILRYYSPETKYGEIVVQKDDQRLYLQALILQSKGDARATEILTHLALSEGDYQTKSIQTLATISSKSGLALPDVIEGELTAINDQFGDSQNGKTASLELIKFRIDRGRFSDSIRTAKLKFTEADPFRLQSITLIGDKVFDDLLSPRPAGQLYALDGYFSDPKFFTPHPRYEQLTLQAHDSARSLGFPELAARLTPELEQLAQNTKTDGPKGADIPFSLTLAQAELALKNSDFEKVIKTLEPIKTAQAASELRRKASLASQNRDLVQRILAEQPNSENRDKSYLEFALQEGHWAEAKLLTTNMKKSAAAKASDDVNQKTSAELAMPFAFNSEKLTYLSAPLNSVAAQSLPDSAVELEAMLADIRNKTRVAKGLLNHAQTETYAP